MLEASRIYLATTKIKRLEKFVSGKKYVFGTQKTSINDGKGTSNITSCSVQTKVCFVWEQQTYTSGRREPKIAQEATKKIQISIMLISNNKTIPFNYYSLVGSEWNEGFLCILLDFMKERGV